MRKLNKYNYDPEERLMFSDSTEGYLLRLKRDPTGEKNWRELASEIKKRTHQNTTRKKKRTRKDFGTDQRKH